MPELDWEDYFSDYVRLLYAMMSRSQPRAEREARAAEMRASGQPVGPAMADGQTLDVPALGELLDRREAARRAWRDFCRNQDVLVGPMSMTAAFPHAEGPFHSRSLVVDGEEVPYFTNIVYPMLAILTGQPSTAFPAGLGKSTGLPVGLQAIGPYLEDHTPLRFAQLLEENWQGFESPPDYA
jgi:amidase